jgi:hypothetical protein
MPYARHILVVASQTAASDELLQSMLSQEHRQPTRFTLVAPAPVTAMGDAAHRNLAVALDRMQGAGLDVTGTVGYGDPFVVFQEEWDPRQFDEVIVSTLPGAVSKWMQIDLPHRIQRMTGVQVTHVVSQSRRSLAGEPLPAHERPGVLSPLSVLAWGRQGSRRP